MTGKLCGRSGLRDPFLPSTQGSGSYLDVLSCRRKMVRRKILGTRGQLAPFLWGLVKGSVKARAVEQ